MRPQINNFWGEDISDKMPRGRANNYYETWCSWYGRQLCGILDITLGTGKAALKYKYVTTCKCALRIHLSYFMFIPLRKSFLNCARSCKMHPLYEIRPPHTFITRNNPTFKKKCCWHLNKQVPGCPFNRKTAVLDYIIHQFELLKSA